MKRRCNNYSLNEEDFWWNQMLDSPTSSLCDEESASKRGGKRKKIKNCNSKDILKTTEEESDEKRRKNKGRETRPASDAPESLQGDNDLRGSDTFDSSLVDSEDGNIPERNELVIKPTIGDQAIMEDHSLHAQNINLSCQSSESEHLKSSVSTDLKENSKICASVETLQRSDTAASAGVEKFLSGVREIFSSCSFQTRRSTRLCEKDVHKTQKLITRDRQLFQNLVSIINCDSGSSFQTPKTDLGSAFPGSSNSGSEWEHSRDALGMSNPAKCKIENIKQSDQDSSGNSIITPSRREPLQISSDVNFSLNLPRCYVKLEKLDMPKMLSEVNDLTGSLTIEKKSEIVDPYIIGQPVENFVSYKIDDYASKEVNSKIKPLYARQHDPKSLSDVNQLEVTGRPAEKEFPRRILKRSASDFQLYVNPERHHKFMNDLIPASIGIDQNAKKKYLSGRKKFLPKQRIVGQVIDARAYKMSSAFKKKKAKCASMKRRSLTSKKKIQQNLILMPSQENANLVKEAQPLFHKINKEQGDQTEVDNLKKDIKCPTIEVKQDEVPPDIFPKTAQLEAQPVAAAGISHDKETDDHNRVTGVPQFHKMPIFVENISPACSDAELINNKNEQDACPLELCSVNDQSSKALEITSPQNPSIEQHKPEDHGSLTEGICGNVSVGNNEIPKKKDESNIIQPPSISSVSSISSSINQVVPIQIPLNNIRCDEPSNSHRFSFELKKRRANPLDPRIFAKKPQAKKRLTTKSKRFYHCNEKQLLEDCRQKLYKLISEGVLEEVSMKTTEKPEKESPEEVYIELDTSLVGTIETEKDSSEILEAFESLNVDIEEAKIPESDGVVPESSAGKELHESDPPTNVPETDAQETKSSSRTRPASKPGRPQDPRRRTDQVAVSKECDSSKDEQKDQSCWDESLEGRTVPNFSSVSLWPHQLEVIPAAPAVDTLDNDAIHKAVTKGDLRIMERVLALLPSHVHWDLEQPDEMGDTLLMVAVKNDDSQMIMLLRNRVNLNHKNHHKKTPLMMAAHNGMLRSVATLLDLGAHIDLRDSKGKTALLLAVENNQDHVVHLLLGRGANYCPLTLTSNNYKDTEEQERAIRINVCLNSHVSWVTKYFDSTVLKWAGSLGLNRLRALTAVQFMTPCQVQKFEFTFSYRQDIRMSDQDRKIILFGTHCVVQYNWFDGELPMPPELVGGVRCNGVRMASYKDSAFMLSNVNKGFNVISIGVRPDLHPEPIAGAFNRDKLAFRAYELSMPPHVEGLFVRKERT